MTSPAIQLSHGTHPCGVEAYCMQFKCPASSACGEVQNRLCSKLYAGADCEAYPCGKAEILSHRGHQALGWRSVSSGLLNNTLSTILFMLYSALQPVLSACVVKARIHARFIPAGCKILRTFEALCKRRGRRSWPACGIQPHRGRVHTPRGRAYTLISCHPHSTKCSVCRAWLFSHGMASHGGHSHGFQ